jgi:23S rRNA (uracil1939-C5)-methyltransferase
MRVGDEITVEPLELVAGGAALARVDGLPLFIRNTYPGDVSVVRITEMKKGFGRAELVRLLAASPDRRILPCPIAEECGGCDWTALRLDRQLEAKRRILTESLRRIGKIDPATLPPITIHPSPLNYRLRSRLHTDPSTGAAGFYAMQSHRVVPLVAECEVVGLETARMVAARNAAVLAAKPSPGLQSPSTRGRGSMPRGTEEGPVDAETDDSPGEEIWELDGEPLVGDHEVSVRVDHYRYELSTRAFFQVNRHLLATLLRLVQGHAARVASRATAIDLYAGIGFFTAPLAALFERVIGVEGATVAHEHASRNLPANVEVVRAAVEGWVERMPEADLVFLDPPRSGARPNVIEAVSRSARSMICFLACDPVTFSRDAHRLIASGWRLSTLDLVDLFPNTHHVETLASFERAP